MNWMYVMQQPYGLVIVMVVVGFGGNWFRLVASHLVFLPMGALLFRTVEILLLLVVLALIVVCEFRIVLTSGKVDVSLQCVDCNT